MSITLKDYVPLGFAPGTYSCTKTQYVCGNIDDHGVLWQATSQTPPPELAEMLRPAHQMYFVDKLECTRFPKDRMNCVLARFVLPGDAFGKVYYHYTNPTKCVLQCNDRASRDKALSYHDKMVVVYLSNTDGVKHSRHAVIFGPESKLHAYDATMHHDRSLYKCMLRREPIPSQPHRMTIQFDDSITAFADSAFHVF